MPTVQKARETFRGFHCPAVPLKLQDYTLDELYVDPVALSAGSLRELEDGNLVLEAPADKSLFN